MIWKDSTSYSRGGDRIPTTWTAMIGNDFRLTVTCGHIYYKGRWIVHCEPFFRDREMGVETKEQAQTKALEMLRAKLTEALAAIPPADSRGER